MNKYISFSKSAKEERKRKKSCDSKTKFDSPQEAYQKGQTFYLCKYCGKYHRSGSLSRLIAFVRKRDDG